MDSMKIVLLLIIPCFVSGTHQRGAIFTWIPNSDGTSVTIQWRISWRRSYSTNLFCNDSTILSGSLIQGEGSLTCFRNCNDTISSLSFLCTDYSDELPDDWSTGKNTVIYKAKVKQFTFGFTGCCWISNLNVGNDSSWSYMSSVDLSVREDSGKINTSPTVDLPPIVHLQYGCNYTIQLPVADIDGDYIRCRWANSTEECAGICNAFPSQAVLNTTACTLTYQPLQKLGYYAAAIQIEDFVSSTSQTPLSSIPLQFLVNVYSGSNCADVPTFVSPTPDDGGCFALDVGERFNVTIKVRHSQPLGRITTLSAVGMVRSTEIATQVSSYHYLELTVTWIPAEDDAGKDHRLCYYATDKNRITGSIRCIKIPVSVVGPTPLRVERVGISNTWIIIIDQTFSRPTEPAYLHVFETDTNTEIFSVDASTSPGVIFDTAAKQVKVSFDYKFNIDKDYHVIIPSGFVKGHVGCGALSVPVNDSAFWAVEIDCGKLKISNGVVNAPNGTIYPNSVVYRCNIGFDLVGNGTRTCTPNGTWTGSEPFCKIRDCGPFAVPQHASLSTNATVYNTTVTFSCILGYEVAGSASLYCDHTPSWNSTPPTCVIVDCGNPPAPPYGSVSTLNGTIYSKIATYTCDIGYDLNGNKSRWCQQNKQWSGSRPTCSPKDCGNLMAPDNGNITVGKTTFGSTVTYHCLTGYIVLGSNTRECLANGSWSFNDPACVIAACPQLQTPGNGSLVVSYGVHAELVGTLTCNEAFKIVGSNTTQCTTKGSWTFPELSCVLIDCGALEPLENGHMSLTGTNFMDNATLSCDVGHELHGSNFRQCLASETWSGNVTLCVPYDCGHLEDISNGTVNVSTTYYRSIAEYSCNAGFDLLGSNMIECQADRRWSSPPPDCQIKDCGKLDDPENGKGQYNLTTFGAETRFICSEGFSLQGYKTINCTANGTWSHPLPQCVQIEKNGILKWIIAGSAGGGGLLLIAVIIIVTVVVVKSRHIGAPSGSTSNEKFFDMDKTYTPKEENAPTSSEDSKSIDPNDVMLHTYVNVGGNIE